MFQKKVTVIIGLELEAGGTAKRGWVNFFILVLPSSLSLADNAYLSLCPGFNVTLPERSSLNSSRAGSALLFTAPSTSTL